MQVNLFAVLRLTQKLLPLMLMDGSSPQTVARTIMVSSGASTKAYRGWGAYCMSKAALNMMTATLAVEEPRVFAVAVRPGVVDTEMQRVIREGGRLSAVLAVLFMLSDTP